MLARSGRDIPISEISVFPLETEIQNDYDSCGLFALNAIDHHFNNSPFLHSDVLPLAQYRMEIALGILQINTVSEF